MAGRSRQYEAFISYSHAADSGLSAALQRALNRIARPAYKWWQWWPPTVFRDQTNLAAAADLSGEIRAALLASSSFVLLASPSAAASPWVNQEVTMWCANKPRERLFIALTGGNLAWDGTRNRFDAARTNSLPPALDGVFETEPLWVDLTGTTPDGSTTRDPRFIDGAATIAAAIRGADKDALIGDDVRQHRRARQLVGSAIALLATLTLLATVAAIYAVLQRNHADERARLATSRQLAAEAVARLDVDPARSLVLAARATTTAATGEAIDALRQALRSSRLRSTVAARAPVFDAQVLRPNGLIAAGLGNGSVRVWRAHADESVSRRLGPGQVLSVDFSRDGRRLLTAGDAGVAILRTSALRTSRPVRFDPFRPAAAVFSPDGEVIATADSDGVVRLWRARTGVAEKQFAPSGRRWPVQDLAFSPDGSRLIAAVGTRVIVWTRHTKVATIFQPHDGIVWSVAFSPDRHHVAAGFADNVARVWDLRTRESVTLSGHEGGIRDVAFSPDGSLLLTASEDETARFWDVASGKALAELRGHGGTVESASFAPDGRTVITGSQDRTIRVWSVTADPIRFQTALHEKASRESQAVLALGFDPRGGRLVTAGVDRAAHIWNLSSGKPVLTLRHGRAADDWVESVQFDRSGRYVLTAGDDGLAKIWNASSGGLLGTLDPDDGSSLYAAAFSPDGRLVVTAGRSGAVRLWRWRPKGLVRTLSGAGSRVDGVTISPDGRWIAAAREDSTVPVWSRADGGSVAVLHASHRLTSVTFDPSGRLLAAGDANGEISIWNLHAKKLLLRLSGHTEAVSDVAFSADGAYLVTVGEDGLAKIWTTADGALVTTVRTRAARLEAASFAPQGRDVAIAGWGGRVMVFKCSECRSPRSLVCLAASRIGPEARAREEDVFKGCD